jgi:hypothetical protein
MAWTTGKIIRRVSLITLIIGGVATIAMCAIAKLYFWMVLFTLIFLSVLLFELLSFLLDGRTISTRFKHFGMQSPWFAWGILFSFLLAMLSLIVHLGVFS